VNPIYLFSILASLAQFDQVGYEFVHDSLCTPALDQLMVGVEQGSSPEVIVLSLLSLSNFGSAEHQRTARLGLVAGLSGGLTSFLIKPLVARSRPSGSDLSSPSFPSSHATIITALAVVYGTKYPSLRLPLAGTVGLVGFSRIYLGKHYPSDVLVGVFIGYGLGRLSLGLEHNLGW
jgi:undecaprenyl-diphosphatase